MAKSSKFGLFSVLILLISFSSCLKGLESSPELIIDPAEYRFWIGWEEIEKRIDSKDWQTINSVETLKLALNYTDSLEKNFGGSYYYTLINLNINLDKIGDVKVRKDSICFIPLSMLKDSISLPFRLIQNKNDTLLVIRNTSNTPSTEVKYKKVYYIDHGEIH